MVLAQQASGVPRAFEEAVLAFRTELRGELVQLKLRLMQLRHRVHHHCQLLWLRCPACCNGAAAVFCLCRPALCNAQQRACLCMSWNPSTRTCALQTAAVQLSLTHQERAVASSNSPFPFNFIPCVLCLWAMPSPHRPRNTAPTTKKCSSSQQQTLHRCISRQPNAFCAGHSSPTAMSHPCKVVG